ncbi:MAG: tol-pal system YbgF family protein [Kiritimatiellales bacterium]
MKNPRVPLVRFLLRDILIAGCFLFSCVGFAQQVSVAPSELASSTLLKEARAVLESGAKAEAIPYLEEVVIRFEGLSTADAVAARSISMFQLGLCYLDAGRYEDAADLFKKFVQEYPENESAMTARFLILEAYAWQDDPTEMKAYIRQLEESGGMDELLAVFKDPAQVETSRHTVLQLVAAYARSADLENLQRFLPYCDESARNDINVNLALLEGGDRSFEAENYELALTFYRMVRTIEEVRTDYDRRLAALDAELKQPLPWVPLTQRPAQQAAHEAEQARYNRMLQEREALAEKDYDLDLKMRIGQTLTALEQYSEAYAVYTEIYTSAPDSDQAEPAQFYAFQSLVALEENARARDEGYAYTERYPEGRYHDEVTLGLMHLHLALNEMDRADDLGRSLLAQVPIHRYLDQVNYLLGYIQFSRQNYEAALVFFRETAEKWPNRTYAEESVYWVGMCHLFLGQFSEAITVFEGYLVNPAWETKEFAEDVTYRLGMARYGLGDFAASEETFKQFLVRFPDSELYSEACSMLGDLRGADGDLDTALDYYAKARKTAVNHDQDKYAVFQIARVYELQRHFKEIIELMTQYLEKPDTENDVAEASLWSAKSWRALGDDGKALDICCETAVRYGNNPALVSVDVLLDQLVQDARQDDQAAQILSRLADPRATACSTAEQQALCLRLTALVAAIGDERAQEQAKALLLTLADQDLSMFSPFPLLRAAEAVAEQGRDELIVPLYDRFMEAFSSTDHVLDMTNLRIEALLRAGQLDDALRMAEEGLDKHSGASGEALTHKLAADALRMSGQYDRAVDMYSSFLGVRAWRGPLTPQVLYWLGICFYDQQRFDEAFAYFQRVYVLYEPYPEWVAKAYEKSAQCLLALNRPDEAANTWREMVANPAVAATPEGRRAQAELDQLGQKTP